MGNNDNNITPRNNNIDLQLNADNICAVTNDNDDNRDVDHIKLVQINITLCCVSSLYKNHTDNEGIRPKSIFSRVCSLLPLI